MHEKTEMRTNVYYVLDCGGKEVVYQRHFALGSPIRERRRKKTTISRHALVTVKERRMLVSSVPG